MWWYILNFSKKVNWCQWKKSVFDKYFALTFNSTVIEKTTAWTEDSICLSRLILEKEGPRSLFRGLGPNLVGVAPSRYLQQNEYYSSSVINVLFNIYENRLKPKEKPTNTHY